MPKYGQKGLKWVDMGPKEVKRCQKGSNGAKIYISRTFGHRSLVDLSFQSERSCFFKCFIYLITLWWPEVLKNAKIGSKETIKMSKGAKIYISWTFGRRSLVDLSFQSERSCFFKCFIYLITLWWPEVLKNAKIGSKETIKMSKGAKIYISRTFGWAKFFEKGDLNHDRPVFYFRVRIKVSGLN